MYMAVPLWGTRLQLLLLHWWHWSVSAELSLRHVEVLIWRSNMRNFRGRISTVAVIALAEAAFFAFQPVVLPATILGEYNEGLFAEARVLIGEGEYASAIRELEGLIGNLEQPQEDGVEVAWLEAAWLEASALSRSGQYAEAKSLLQRIAALTKGEYGPTTGDGLPYAFQMYCNALMDLVAVYCEETSFEESEALLRRVVGVLTGELQSAAAADTYPYPKLISWIAGRLLASGRMLERLHLRREKSGTKNPNVHCPER